MDNHEILEKIGQSDMVLAGLGEDFDGSAFLGKDERYLAGCGKLKEAGFRWLMPAWNEYCAEKSGNNSVETALERLGEILRGKNFFAVSVSTDSRAADLGLSLIHI